MKETSNTKQTVNNIRNKAFNKYQAVLKIRYDISNTLSHSINIYEQQSFTEHRNNI